MSFERFLKSGPSGPLFLRVRVERMDRGDMTFCMAEQHRLEDITIGLKVPRYQIGSAMYCWYQKDTAILDERIVEAL